VSCKASICSRTKNFAAKNTKIRVLKAHKIQVTNYPTILEWYVPFEWFLLPTCFTATGVTRFFAFGAKMKIIFHCEKKIFEAKISFFCDFRL